MDMKLLRSSFGRYDYEGMQSDESKYEFSGL